MSGEKKTRKIPSILNTKYGLIVVFVYDEWYTHSLQFTAGVQNVKNVWFSNIFVSQKFHAQANIYLNIST